MVEPLIQKRLICLYLSWWCPRRKLYYTNSSNKSYFESIISFLWFYC